MGLLGLLETFLEEKGCKRHSKYFFVVIHSLFYCNNFFTFFKYQKVEEEKKRKVGEVEKPSEPLEKMFPPPKYHPQEELEVPESYKKHLFQFLSNAKSCLFKIKKNRERIFKMENMLTILVHECGPNFLYSCRRS